MFRDIFEMTRTKRDTHHLSIYICKQLDYIHVHVSIKLKTRHYCSLVNQTLIYNNNNANFNPHVHRQGFLRFSIQSQSLPNNVSADDHTHTHMTHPYIVSRI